MSRPHVTVICALAAVVLSGIAVVATISQRDWNITALIRMQEAEPMAELARETDPDFAFVGEGHFDGVYYYAIARDPLARGDEHTRIDQTAYRYGHAGYGWMTWALSGGQEDLVPAALLLLGFAGAAAAGALGSTLFKEHGISPWAGMLVAVNPGLIFAVAFDTSESVGAAFLFGALLAWTKRRWLIAGVLLVGLCLIKEWFIFVPAGLLVWEAVQWVRGRRPQDIVKKVAALAAGPVAFGIWYLYLTLRFDHLPYEDATGNFDLPPLAGWFDSFEQAVTLGFGDANSVQLSYMAVPFLAAVGGLLLFGFAAALRLRTAVDVVYILFALVIFSASWLILLYPKDLIRTITMPLLLMPIVLLGRPPSWSGAADER